MYYALVYTNWYIEHVQVHACHSNITLLCVCVETVSIHVRPFLLLQLLYVVHTYIGMCMFRKIRVFFLFIFKFFWKFSWFFFLLFLEKRFTQLFRHYSAFTFFFGIHTIFGIFRQNKKCFPGSLYPKTCSFTIISHLPLKEIIRQMPRNPSSRHNQQPPAITPLAVNFSFAKPYNSRTKGEIVIYVRAL